VLLALHFIILHIVVYIDPFSLILHLYLPILHKLFEIQVDTIVTILTYTSYGNIFSSSLHNVASFKIQVDTQ
jgi:hypothetical protein